MINFDEYTNENKVIHNLNWPFPGLEKQTH